MDNRQCVIRNTSRQQDTKNRQADNVPLPRRVVVQRTPLGGVRSHNVPLLSLSKDAKGLA